nr:uncharacterized protein CI109_000085 [Kwoniella shandongensis]KAA5531245.1 hypothetical protein CI109_000085 [Kwoniella shandongensis]
MTAVRGALEIATNAIAGPSTSRCLRLTGTASRYVSSTRTTSRVTRSSTPLSIQRRRTTSSINYRPAAPSSTSNTPPKPPRRPSPYRLLQPHAFLADFAPLHVKGWRLDALEPQERLVNPTGHVDEGLSADKAEGADLQSRRLVRVYEFGDGKEGWRDLLRFVAKTGEVIEEEDHHPSILISPSSDYKPILPSSSPLSDRTYVVELSTHTHTPLPPYPLTTKGGKMKPGVTGKDVKLAERVEGVFEEVTGGKGMVQVKRE